jgi:very-short-patch-repair endonuclease
MACANTIQSPGRSSHQKRNGGRELRRVMTPEERILWERLRSGRLRGLKFRHQQVIAGFIVDFYCDACRLAVELDGNMHAHQRDYDAERDATLAAHGIRVFRIPNREVYDQPGSVLARILAACEHSC